MVAATPSIAFLYTSLPSWKERRKGGGRREVKGFSCRLLFSAVSGETFPRSTRQGLLFCLMGHLVTLAKDYGQKRIKLLCVIG